MPELPEVETVVRQLSSILIDKKVVDVWIDDSKLGVLPSFPFSGARIKTVKRLGKQIVVTFTTDENSCPTFYLIVHLRMTGRLLWHPNDRVGERVPDFTYINEKEGVSSRLSPRATVEFEDGTLDFLDVRRFGTFQFASDLEAFLPTGIDPLFEDFTYENLSQMVGRCRQTAKQFLLRQDRLVGLGNIYVCECLFRCRIHPERITHTLTPKEIRRLYDVIPDVLRQAIKQCGTTFSDFQNAEGSEGGFQNFLRVYQKEGQPCLECGSAILRISQQGRSSFYCPKCQI